MYIYILLEQCTATYRFLFSLREDRPGSCLGARPRRAAGKPEQLLQAVVAKGAIVDPLRDDPCRRS